MPIDSFFPFRQLIVHYSLLVPPHAEHCLLSEMIWPYRRCWFFVRWKLQFFAFEILEVNPLLIASNNLMQETLSFMSQKQNFGSGSPIYHLSINSCSTHFPPFLIFPIACKRLGIPWRFMFNFNSIMLTDRRSQLFLCFRSAPYHQCWSRLF